MPPPPEPPGDYPAATGTTIEPVWLEPYPAAWHEDPDAATMVSLVAYQGLRVPEELLALEVRHVRRNTVLVEQRNINGRPGGRPEGTWLPPRAIDLLDPVRRDVRAHMVA